MNSSGPAVRILHDGPAAGLEAMARASTGSQKPRRAFPALEAQTPGHEAGGAARACAAHLRTRKGVEDQDA